MDKIDELHQDIAGAAGYIMMLIPFLAYGFVSNVGSAFSNLATSMTGHVQGSTMAVAGEAASASFGLGQTSFYNTSANNFSANKHDSNWTHMQGMHTEQLGSGVLKTLTGSGDSVFDVSPGMTRSAVSINAQEGLSASLNQAYEHSTQMARHESANYQRSLSNFAHRALQLSSLSGHDLRLGDGVSESETGQYSKALSTIRHIAEDVATKTGMSREDALAHLTSGGWGASVGVKSQGSIWGKLAEWGTGFQGGVDAHTKFDRSSTSSDRYHAGVDNSLSAREAHDFNEALNYVNHFAKNHHFDESHSQAASLSDQLGADLREAETASQTVDASLSQAQRINHAKSYVESHSAQISKNLDQAFPGYVARTLGESARDELYNHPGSMQSLNKLQALGQDFIAQKRDEFISTFGHQGQQAPLETSYQKERDVLMAKEHTMARQFHQNSDQLSQEAKPLKVGLDNHEATQFQKATAHQLHQANAKSEDARDSIQYHKEALTSDINRRMAIGKTHAQKNLMLPEDWSTKDRLNEDNEE